MECFRNGDSVKWNKFSNFFYWRIVTLPSHLWHALYLQCWLSVPLQFSRASCSSPSSYESLYLKNMNCFNQRRQQKRKLILIFKYLGSINRSVFSLTNSPFCRYEWPHWWWSIADTHQQENGENQLKKSLLTLNQLKVFSIWFHPRGLYWFN